MRIGPLTVMAYGFVWGYIVHAKEIDKKLAVIAADSWEQFQRYNHRLRLDETDRHLLRTGRTSLAGLQAAEDDARAAG